MIGILRFFFIAGNFALICGAMEPAKSISMPSLPTLNLNLATRKYSYKSMEEIAGKSVLKNPFIAVRKKDLNALKRIVRLQYIFDQNMQEENTGLTLLHYAVLNSDAPAIRYLMLELKARADIQSSGGKTALDIATEYGHIGTIIKECQMNAMYAEAQSSSRLKKEKNNA